MHNIKQNYNQGGDRVKEKDGKKKREKRRDTEREKNG